MGIAAGAGILGMFMLVRPEGVAFRGQGLVRRPAAAVSAHACLCPIPAAPGPYGFVGAPIASTPPSPSLQVCGFFQPVGSIPQPVWRYPVRVPDREREGWGPGGMEQGEGQCCRTTAYLVWRYPVSRAEPRTDEGAQGHGEGVLKGRAATPPSCRLGLACALTASHLLLLHADALHRLPLLHLCGLHAQRV